MKPDDRDYFTARAEAEMRSALASDHPEAARAHSLLATFYRGLAHRLADPTAR